jgi:hypothetical protein
MAAVGVVYKKFKGQILGWLKALRRAKAPNYRCLSVEMPVPATLTAHLVRL